VAGLRHLRLIDNSRLVPVKLPLLSSTLLPIQLREECLAERNSQGKIGPLALPHLFSTGPYR